MFNKEKSSNDMEKDWEVTIEEVVKTAVPNADLPPVPALKLYQYASSGDKLMILVAIVCSILNGISQPLLFLVFSNVIGLFGDFQKDYDVDPQLAVGKLQDEVNWLCVLFVIIGSVTAVAAYFQISLWLVLGEHQAVKIRNMYYKSVLAQDMGWFDNVQSGEVATRIAGDVNQVQDGISDKVGLLIQYFSTVIGGFLIAFLNGWKLTLVLMCVVPLLTGCGIFFGKMISQGSFGGVNAYGEAGFIAEQALSAVRTVYSFNAQAREQSRYEEKLVVARAVGLRKAVLSGLSMGTVMLILFSNYALAMWYGGRLIFDNEYNASQVLTVFFNVLIGAMYLGQTTPSFIALATAQGAASKLFQVIENKSKINPFLATPAMVAQEKTITPVQGKIEFKNVVFNYPSRPDIPILKNLSLVFEPGETVALVGSSGSGKSTTVGLIERFYDPISGQVTLDGMDLKTVSTKFLRDNIGIVGQEPVLFATTIKSNILLGLKDDEELKSDPVQLQHRVEKACKLANIHQFITSLPKGYETVVGEKGGQLSGGQKQRIAIARAIIKSPQILLLDEATSALDTESEKIVQIALDQAAKNRTTIIIAHRLSTIKKADKIVVFDRGTILEQGTHEQLLNGNGRYAELVQAQYLRTQEHTTELEKGSKDNVTKKNTPDHLSLNIEEQEAEVLEDYADESILKIDTKAKSLHKPKNLADKRRQKETVPILRLLKMCAKWWVLFLIGTIGAIFEGASFPMYGVILTHSTQAFFTIAKGDLVQGQSDVNFWSLMFLVLGLCCLFAYSSRLAGFSSVGEHLTYDIRRRCFQHLLAQEISYYDEPDNAIGIVTAKLSTEAEHMQGLISKVMGATIMATACTVIGFAISFASGWKLTLVAVACLPLTVFAQLFSMNSLTDINKQTKKAYLKVSQIAMESITNIRTLASLNREQLFYQDYLTRVNKAHQLANKGFFKAALGYSVAMSAPLFINALVFWYGTKLVVNMEYTYVDMFQVISVIMFTGNSLGFVSAELTSFVKSKVAAIEVFELLDRVPKIDASPDFGEKQMPIFGNVNAENAYFAYSSRKNVPVLRGLDLSVLMNKKVALVGASGSGKSTLFALLQRFYDLDQGTISVEQKDVTQWNVPYLRSTLSMVGQEPTLFDTTVAENIAYGAEQPITQLEIERCAKMANAHNFITQLSEGYDTQVGERGSKLSGGQKQRIAIARALIRNPKILLLDEATSALDSQSEQIVQEALDNAAHDRTTITIAHRLSTIQNCDLIIVFREGRKVEQGTHDQLLAIKGYYYSLVNQQNLSVGSS